MGWTYVPKKAGVRKRRRHRLARPFNNWALAPAVAVIAIPLIWWVTRTPDRQASMFATCDGLSLSTPAVLRFYGVTKIEASGLDARLDLAEQRSAEDLHSAQSISLPSPEIQLQNIPNSSPAALTVSVTPPSSPLVLALAENASIEKPESNDTVDYLNTSADRLSLTLQAERFDLNAYRVSMPNEPNHSDLHLTVGNVVSMAQVKLSSAGQQKSSAQLTVPKNSAFEVEPHGGGDAQLTFRRCTNVSISLDGTKVQVPDMAMVDLLSNWRSVELSRVAMSTKRFDKPAGIFLAIEGKLFSLKYNGTELNKTRLSDLFSLSAEKGTLAGLALAAMIWAAAKIFDYFFKIMLDGFASRTKWGKAQ
jgi:hypothetical protein